MMNINKIESPSVLVDLDIVERNINRFQAYCNKIGMNLRPHIKTHKLPFLAKLQLDAGAIGITCQKISEAEAMISEGDIDDVLLTYNILGAEKYERLRELAKKVRLSVVADNITVVDGLSAAFLHAENPLHVLVECNTGADRCGVTTPKNAADLAEIIDAKPGLKFSGLMTYPPSGSLEKVQSWLVEARKLIKDKGIEVAVISSGGTPNMWNADAVPIATEYRIGTYIYNDASVQKKGVCKWSDCALTVLATVVSVPAKNRAVIDAGSKVLTSDLLGLTGYGHVVDRDDLVIDQLSEEHGRIVSSGAIGLNVGDRIRIIPNHACVVSNMLDHVVLIRGDQVEARSKVVARGQVW